MNFSISVLLKWLESKRKEKGKTLVHAVIV